MVRWRSVVFGVVVAGVVGRLGWVYWERGRPGPARAEKVNRLPKELDTVELKILNFYTAERAVRGEPFLVCYGVLNAVRVEMEPPLAEVKPVLSRCVNVVLKKETELTLRAYGKEGEEATASFVVGVEEPRPEFTFVSMSGRTFKRGEPWTVCYGVKKATRVYIEPEGRAVGLGEKVCAMWYPGVAPRRIVAESAGGRETVRLPVRMIE